MIKKENPPEQVVLLAGLVSIYAKGQDCVFVDCLTVFTLVARTLSRVFVETVNCLRQQTRDSGLARSAWSREEIGVTDSVCFDGVGQGLDDVVLSDHGIPLFWAVLAVEGLGHFLVGSG